MATATIASERQKLPAAPVLTETFAECVAAHRTRLYHVALRQLGNPDDAQDAVQDALLSACRHLDQFQGRAELSTWLTRIVINAAHERRRRAAARPALALDQLPDSGQSLPDARPTPETLCARTERQARLYRLLRRLSPALRAAVVAYELDGLSCNQAAARLGIKPAALKCRVFRGRARLHELATSCA